METKTEENVISREFNEISVDREQAILQKRSDRTERLNPEIRWYRELPEDLKTYVPAIIDSEISENRAEIRMRYLDHPSLGELALDDSEVSWEKIFSDIFRMIEEFRRHRPEYQEGRVESLGEVYISKTRRRLEALRADESFSGYFNSEHVEINGEKMKSAKHILAHLEELLDELLIEEEPDFCVIHGDLHFSNIIYGPEAKGVKLIDPRGRFGEFDLYGDPHYDLAKLRHSTHGKYDLIAQDRFEIEIDEESVSYSVDDFENGRLLEELLEESLNDGNWNREKIRVIESLLFLSMGPLHAENEERQQVMLARGIELFNERVIQG